jgi:hypothetical protein
MYVIAAKVLNLAEVSNFLYLETYKISSKKASLQLIKDR